MTAIIDMTPAELRIACAEKCGWKNIRWIESISGKWLCGDHPNLGSEIPKFQIDRNALHELILAVPREKIISFTLALQDILYPKHPNIQRCPSPQMVQLYDFMIASPISIMRAFLTVMEDV